ncbi:MAG: AAA family ATPase [Bacillota bacterium]
MELMQIRNLAQKVKENISRFIVGKDEVADLLQVVLISSGRVLLEDVPGTGKTLLSKAMAKSLNTSFRRIQFTPDLLPPDLLPPDLSGISFITKRWKVRVPDGFDLFKYMLF